ncbi:chorismate lyase [Pseudidiomarina aestuarii]|uniref:Probable chorismate pyruvate-lyase n=1 Tax=Pseudidiomarina aestuarii TaxID=624146 RepID=A0A7Z6ZV84_9GAMM|nr:chorismate lyase [Pseudidiomarina aestuarii]RUO41897.1 chorismate lyase [Pseudidiomarina aestuarii]
MSTTPFPTITFPVVSTGGEAEWLAPSEVRVPLSQQHANWLLDPGSLTAKLKELSVDFRVQVLGQRETTLLADEKPWLGDVKRAAVREVILWCDGQPWVFARSVFPPSALAAQQLSLGTLGDSPLGEHLFRQPDLARSAIELCRLTPTSRVGQLHQQLGYPAHELWGRRSCFYAANQTVLVAEVFLGAAKLYSESPSQG